MPASHGLTLRRPVSGPNWLIAGTDLYVARTTGGFTVDCAYSKAASWLDRNGFARGCVFARRDDLLRAISAAAAADPLPRATQDVAPPVAVRRDQRGDHVTADGRIRIRRSSCATAWDVLERGQWQTDAQCCWPPGSPRRTCTPAVSRWWAGTAAGSTLSAGRADRRACATPRSRSGMRTGRP